MDFSPLAIGASSSFFGSVSEEVFRAYDAADIRLMEVSFGKISAADAIDWKSVGRYADAYGVEIFTYHLPFSPFSDCDPASRDESKRRAVAEAQRRRIARAAEVGVTRFVFHASSEPIPDSERARTLDAAIQSVGELSDCAAKHGGVLLIEDLPRTCIGHHSDEILAILHAVPEARVVFDTNHLLIEDNLHFLRAIGGEKILSTHISDYDLIDECHVLPGEGKVDFPALIRTMREVGYRGPLMYEVSADPHTRLGERQRPLTLDDLCRNHAALLDGRMPDPVTRFPGRKQTGN